ncbi:MAG: polyprenyl synthetase family protein [Nitrospirota bacterium]
MTITDVFECYRKDLVEVEEQIQAGLESRAVLIKQVGNYLLQGGGKRIRPLLLMISANLCGNPGRESVRMAAMVEFIHTASLLHDDVVDDADVRRGRAAANNLWGNQATVLVGDFLYSKALYDSVQLENHRVLDSISDATRTMSEGEVLQLLKTGDPDITEDEYMEVIKAKTAALISSACRIGAILGSMPIEKEEALAGYGMDVGLAFQLLDDALDYTAKEDKLGKALGKDLGEGKMTLPLIHLVSSSKPEESSRIHDIISAQSQRKTDLDFVLSLMKYYRSIEYAVDRATSYIERAKARLAVFPASPHKDALDAVADYVVEREM